MLSGQTGSSCGSQGVFLCPPRSKLPCRPGNARISLRLLRILGFLRIKQKFIAAPRGNSS
ncbi:MAG TPA: hypothetical protein DDW78_02720 [Treponema sp.]|nr:hypothetical protein [Treponema sp.]